MWAKCGQEILKPTPEKRKSPAITGMYGAFTWRNRWDLNPNLRPLFQQEYPKIPENSAIFGE